MNKQFLMQMAVLIWMLAGAVIPVFATDPRTYTSNQVADMTLDRGCTAQVSLDYLPQITTFTATTLSSTTVYAITYSSWQPNINTWLQVVSTGFVLVSNDSTTIQNDGWRVYQNATLGIPYLIRYFGQLYLKGQPGEPGTQTINIRRDMPYPVRQ